MLLTAPRPGERTRAGPFHGSSDALAIAELAGSVRPLLAISADASSAQRLKTELAFFAPTLKTCVFPDWETLPYDTFSPHADLVSERLATLYELMRGTFDVAIVPVTTALTRLMPVEYLAANTFFFKQGGKLAPDELRHQCTIAGYTHVTQVVAPGEYSFRGGLIDIFPMGSALPYRIDLFDEDIDSIRSFDVDSQRSIYKVNEVRLLPAREFPMNEAAQTRFRQNFRVKFEGDPSKSRVYKDVSKGVPSAGIEYYLPLFFEATARFTDYLPEGTVICAVCGQQGLQEAVDAFWQDTHSRYATLRGDRANPVMPPHDLFLTPEELFASIKPFARVEMAASVDTIPPTAALPALGVERRADNPLHRLGNFLAGYKGRVLLLADSPGRRETMQDFLAEYELRPAPAASFDDFRTSPARLMLGVATLHTGFTMADDSFALITENELYATQARNRSAREARKTTAEGMLRDLSEVKAGDPVVHEQHGIGRYLGLESMDLGEGDTEFLTLEYARGDKLYVQQFGGEQWEKAKKKAAEQAHDTAAELLNIYAQRALRQGHAFGLKHHDYEAFADGFPFEETPDQAAAIKATLDDLTSGKPMDRLVCGDVGFGKTEVALRAAYVAVADGKQVAVLVPTTLLAEQHFNTFTDRFADWPVKIAELSRFRSAKEQTEALAGLAAGSVDIAIGTHKLVQRGVKFKNLGLVIIDEEHRFGVRHKEQLKALRAEVDVLTLTATPIPRTLALSMEGLRDFSVIATAPQRRLAIKTFVSRFSKAQIREAALRELKRGGQIYFLHNEIDTIRHIEEMLTQLLPEARIRVAHGQMRERELELAMRDFYQQRFNILLCTTIIETGIDVPTANTIIINRADRFGLAQLHQLRGRVGRSHHQAYAYLLLPDEGNITTQAKKRLEAIQMMEELGSGFFLAMHDLEIRGAGEVLGESQSGEMQEVGFNMYAAMLDTAVRALKAGKEPDLAAPLGVTTEINLHVPALLPSDYCSDVHERLVLYKRLANCDNDEELERLREELIDRFGELPVATRALIDSHRLRLAGKVLGIARIDASETTIQLQFIPKPPIDPMKIIKLIQTKRNFKLAGQDKLRIEASTADVAARVALIKQVFHMLS
jgi:transcription-repair coupling factor (superfamily II helicase)